MTQRILGVWRGRSIQSLGRQATRRIVCIRMDLSHRAAEVSPSFDGELDDASAAKKRFHTIIRARLLIPGDGAPIENGALVIEDKLIAWVGLSWQIPRQYTIANHRLVDVPYPDAWPVGLPCALCRRWAQ